jgi:hypothetical protein
LNIPNVGDAVFIQSDEYTGDATVTYVDNKNLYEPHMYPIQVDVDEGELHQFEEFNHGQQMYRTNLNEIAGIQTQEHIILNDQQFNLFDDF